MGQLAKWLLHEDQKEFFDYVFAVALNAVFLVLVALPAARCTAGSSISFGRCVDAFHLSGFLRDILFCRPRHRGWKPLRPELRMSLFWLSHETREKNNDYIPAQPTK
jgi:hypothetical protein